MIIMQWYKNQIKCHYENIQEDLVHRLATTFTIYLLHFGARLVRKDRPKNGITIPLFGCAAPYKENKSHATSALQQVDNWIGGMIICLT